MKQILLIFSFITIITTRANAQSISNNDTLNQSYIEYWQIAEGNVKVGNGYFVNKLPFKSNYDLQEDFEICDSSITTKRFFIKSKNHVN